MMLRSSPMQLSARKTDNYSSKPRSLLRGRFWLVTTGINRPKVVAPSQGLPRSNLRHNLIVNGPENSIHMNMHTPYELITIVDEPTYSFNSTDNAQPYALDVLLTDESITSIHGVKLNGGSILVVGAGGGGTAIHSIRHSCSATSSIWRSATTSPVCR